MKADYTKTGDSKIARSDGDNRQMKADYTAKEDKALLKRDGDNRQMKADYTCTSISPKECMMEITAK